MQTKEMIATHPDVHGNVNQALIDAIDGGMPVLRRVPHAPTRVSQKRWWRSSVSASG